MFNPFLVSAIFQNVFWCFKLVQNRKEPLTSNMLACGYKRIAIEIKITELLVKKDHVTSLEFYIFFQFQFFFSYIRKWFWFRGSSIKYTEWEGGWPKARVCCFSDLILLLKGFWRCWNELFSAQNLYHFFTKNNKRK